MAKKLQCPKCGRKFEILMRLFSPVTGEAIHLCGGECSSEIMRYNQLVCRECDESTFSRFEPIDPGGDKWCTNCKRF
jgi:DNA-directed RNA polymerase subunit RPC12/RpoP